MRQSFFTNSIAFYLISMCICFHSLQRLIRSPVCISSISSFIFSSRPYYANTSLLYSFFINYQFLIYRITVYWVEGLWSRCDILLVIEYEDIQVFNRIINTGFNLGSYIFFSERNHHRWKLNVVLEHLISFYGIDLIVLNSF